MRADNPLARCFQSRPLFARKQRRVQPIVRPRFGRPLRVEPLEQRMLLSVGSWDDPVIPERLWLPEVHNDYTAFVDAGGRPEDYVASHSILYHYDADRVLVEVRAQNDFAGLIDTLEACQFDVTFTAHSLGLAGGWMPIGQFEAIATAEEIASVLPVFRPEAVDLQSYDYCVGANLGFDDASLLWSEGGVSLAGPAADLAEAYKLYSIFVGNGGDPERFIASPMDHYYCDGNRILVEVGAAEGVQLDALTATLQKLDFELTATHASRGLVAGWMPVGELEAIATSDQTASVLPLWHSFHYEADGHVAEPEEFDLLSIFDTGGEETEGSQPDAGEPADGESDAGPVDAWLLIELENGTKLADVVEPALARLYFEYEAFVGAGDPVEDFVPSDPALPIQGDRVGVKIRAVDSFTKLIGAGRIAPIQNCPLRNDLEALGVEFVGAVGSNATLWVPFELIDDVAALDGIRYVRMSDLPATYVPPSTDDTDTQPGELEDEPENPLDILDLPEWFLWTDEEALDALKVTFLTEMPITDIDTYVETLDWPEAIGPITGADVRLSHSCAIRDGYLTVTRIQIRAEIDIMEAMAELQKLDFVRFVDRAPLEKRPEMDPNKDNSPFAPPSLLTGDLPEMDPNTGSQEPVFLHGQEGPRFDDPEFWYMSPTSTEILISLHTEEPITDLGAYLASKDWPHSAGPVTADNVVVRLSVPLLSPLSGGGYRTIVSLYKRAETDLDQAIAELGELEFVRCAKLASKVGLQFTPELEELIKATTYTGSKEPIYLHGQQPLDRAAPESTDGPPPMRPMLPESGDLIRLDDFQADERFTDIDGTGYAAVIIDTGIDLDHPFFGPDEDEDGIAAGWNCQAPSAAIWIDTNEAIDSGSATSRGELGEATLALQDVYFDEVHARNAENLVDDLLDDDRLPESPEDAILQGLADPAAFDFTLVLLGDWD